MTVFEIRPVVCAADVADPDEAAKQVGLLRALYELVSRKSLDPRAGTASNQGHAYGKAQEHYKCHDLFQVIFRPMGRLTGFRTRPA